MKNNICESKFSIYILSFVVLIVVHSAVFLTIEVFDMTKASENFRTDGLGIFILLYLFLLFRKFTLTRRCIVLSDDLVGLKYGMMFNDYAMENIQDINVETGTTYGVEYIKLSKDRREMVLYRYMFSAQDYDLINHNFQASDNAQRK